jgi:hypothetical protein
MSTVRVQGTINVDVSFDLVTFFASMADNEHLKEQYRRTDLNEYGCDPADEFYRPIAYLFEQVADASEVSGLGGLRSRGVTDESDEISFEEERIRGRGYGLTSWEPSDFEELVNQVPWLNASPVKDLITVPLFPEEKT